MLAMPLGACLSCSRDDDTSSASGAVMGPPNPNGYAGIQKRSSTD